MPDWTDPKECWTSLNVLGHLHSQMCCILSASTCIPPVINDMTKALHLLHIKVYLSKTKVEVVVVSVVGIWVWDASHVPQWRENKDVVHVYMDESTNVVLKDCCHQLLESRGCITITHLHHLAPKGAKDCNKCCSVYMIWYNVYLFICLGCQVWIDMGCKPCHYEWHLDQGMTSLIILVFCLHRLKTVLSLPLFFSTHGIGCAIHAARHSMVTLLWQMGEQ